MKTEGPQITAFYCSRQGEKATRILKDVNGAALRVRKSALPCSGKLEVFQLTRALENGADGVVVFSCPEEHCRYVVGSTRAEGRVHYAGKILESIGLGGERVHRFVLAGDPDSGAMNEFAVWLGKIAALEPLPRKT